MRGLLDDKKRYPSREYATMISDVRDLRKEYENATTYEARKKLAAEDLKRWTTYLEVRKQKLQDPDLKEHWINPG